MTLLVIIAAKVAKEPILVNHGHKIEGQNARGKRMITITVRCTYLPPSPALYHVPCPSHYITREEESRQLKK